MSSLPPHPPTLPWPELLARLNTAAPQLRSAGDWPREQFQWLALAGQLRRGIPDAYGGEPESAGELLRRYIDLAEACLVTTFVLTQRQAAISRIVAADAADLQSELLPRLATGDLFATVGISHLTTSRQHVGRPAVQVVLRPTGIELSGEVPWVTGAHQADVIVTGGTDDAGQQFLVALPLDSAGVLRRPAVELLALSAAGTAAVELRNVRLPLRYVLAGPEARVLQRGTGAGTGSLGTSALAVGLSLRAVRLLSVEARPRPELESTLERLQAEQETLTTDLLAAASADDPRCGTPESLRERANSLALRATQALLAASKGAGYVAGHPAERAVREALFFLVWSCPQPVVAAALRSFACLSS